MRLFLTLLIGLTLSIVGTIVEGLLWLTAIGSSRSSLRRPTSHWHGEPENASIELGSSPGFTSRIEALKPDCSAS